MKGSFVFYAFFVLVFVLNSNCEKEENPVLPTISTEAVSAITDTTIICGGNVTSDGGAPVIALGVCWAETENPTIASHKTTDGSGIKEYTSTIKGFLPGRVYHIRAYATNSVGTAYGEDITATSNVVLPRITTQSAWSITTTSAMCGGHILSDGGDEIVAKGICWNTAGNPTIHDNKTTEVNSSLLFSSNLSGLGVFQFYYLRAYATNSAGTAYGEEISFRTRSAVTVNDVDGNVYNTVTIGTQVWMAENLRTSHYRNNVSIPEVTGDNAWVALTSGAYCKYNNDPDIAGVYGNLYNAYVVTNTNNVCPTGWHVPSEVEWEVLIENLGGNSVAGGAMKEAGIYHWASPNEGATNSSGFSALPGGYRGDYNDGRFFFKSILADFWTSHAGWFIRVVSSNDDVQNNIGTEESSGKSIRCIKD